MVGDGAPRTSTWRRRAGRAPAREDRFGGEPAGEQRLADAFAGHHVGRRRRRRRRTACVRRSSGDLVDAGRDRPRGVAILELEAGRRAPRRCGVGWSRSSQMRLHRLDPAFAVAEHTEADVDATVGQRERPGVAGREVGLEPHVQLLGGRAGDVPGVLAEAVPLTEVARLAGAERLADRAPHAVGGDDVSRGDASARRRRRRRGRAVLFDRPSNAWPSRMSAPASRGELARARRRVAAAE